ncbi:hypothetical protein [Bartonella rattaustraliani]|uniref:hypothetical protein n=1 Tax=Bartonella rattaustraliani TaxID=481139 RepID=UPI0003691BD0|nr:hypothetical protein [Bartonella rattaustraliani]
MLNKITDQSSRLMKARLIRGFKSAKAATKYFGWNYSSYIQHEQGIRGISRASKKYATAFKVSEAWLLTGEGDGPSTLATDLAQTVDQKIIDLLQITNHADKEAIFHILNSLNSEKKK